MKIKKHILDTIIAHAKKEAPLECCGYLAGSSGIITQVYALANVDKSNEHFSFDTKEQFAAMRDARAKGLEICSVYHSHPASPARPSQEDIKLAYDPDILYTIVSLAGEKEEVKVFRIKSRKAEPVDLEVVDNESI